MKYIFLLILTCLLTLSVSAQRVAVMEFKAGVGVSQNDVDGLCGMFTTGFRPSGYTIIERSQIDRIVSEQNMQRSNLTEVQMIKIGKLLNLSCIVIADVNIVMGEYNVDVRVINVESGVVVETDGKSFTGSYGDNMRTLAKSLADKIAIKPNQVSDNENDYVDLGLPSGTKWKRKNENDYYNFADALQKFGDKVPTLDQWNELNSLCNWSWQGDGFIVTGRNGLQIFLPASGLKYSNGEYVKNRGCLGSYWSNTEAGESNANGMYFENSQDNYGNYTVYEHEIYKLGKSNLRSVRLVK